MTDTLTMPEVNRFEIAVLSERDVGRPFFCFPHSGCEFARWFGHMLPTGDISTRGFYSQRWWLPVMIINGQGRWLALRSLLETDGLLLVVDLDSPRWRRIDVDSMPMDVLKLGKTDCRMFLYEGECIAQRHGTVAADPFSRLAVCCGHGSMDTAADCIGALADIIGCGLELTIAPYDDHRDVDTGVAATMALYMLMLCLLVGADRCCHMTIDRRDGEVVVSLAFRLCLDEICCSNGEEWVEIAACRHLADAHNVSFELRVEQGGVRCRFNPVCHEWSRLGIKIPTGLEYD